ncbi:Galactoside 2-alpha-L-fucosyltransferase 1 [Bulinus truncatus]|nr:Galactoside 2-alpha-L-fucosyltransferase 1 [Bulinus truncatus]
MHRSQANVMDELVPRREGPKNMMNFSRTIHSRSNKMYKRLFLAICLIATSALAVYSVLQITAKNISPEERSNENVTSNISVTNPKSQTTQPVTPPLYLTATIKGRLGNQMFIYATILGLARAQNRKLFLKDGQDLITTFQVSFINNGISNSGWKVLKERTYSTFDPMLMKLPKENLTLFGHLQTWRYFPHAQDEIRREFTFLPALRKYANDAITHYRSQLDNHVIVGVHIRRGDILDKIIRDFGYIAANASYFTHAFSKMRSLLPNQNITFLVASEDQEWCKQNLNDSSVRVLPPGSASEHMAILASCDHVIITGGTYSFMAAWLANGITIYNTKHYSQTAPVRVGFTDADFFLPGWIGVE